MIRRLFPLLFVVLLAGALPAAGAGGPAAAGMGINLAAVGRLIGNGNTLFLTAVDITNNAGAAAQVDFYFDGTSNGEPVAATGSISSAGALVAQGTGGDMPAHHNVHFDDFVDALVKANMLTADVETNGVIGSTLFVFGGFNKSGQGAVTARFYNDGCGGTVGQAINGREITNAEPTKLVVTARNTIGEEGPQLYSNLFVNNTGLTPGGVGVASADDILVTAISATTGVAVGKTVTLSGVNPGATGVISNVFPTMSIPNDEDTVILEIQVTSGTSALDAVVVAIDSTTKDGTTTKAANGSF